MDSQNSSLTRRESLGKTEKSPSELLRDTVRQWHLLWGKKLNEETMEVWMSLFVLTPARILAVALEKVTRGAERMPTPGALTRAVAGQREQIGLAAQPGERNCTCEQCKGTGYKVVAVPEHVRSTPDSQWTVKCHCHAEHAMSQEPYDVLGPNPDGGDDIPCKFDPRNGEYLYRAVDCPEGREYLAGIRKFWERHSFPQPSTEKEVAAKAWHEKQALSERLNAAKQGEPYTPTDDDLPDIMRPGK